MLAAFVRRRADPLAAAVWALVCIALRAPLLGGPLWRDEASTVVAIAARDFHTFLATVFANELTPPLYYVIERAWTGVAGLGEVALRLPSLVFVALGVVLLYGAVLRAGGRLAANLAAAFATLAPLTLTVGIEARSYGLTFACASLLLYTFVRGQRVATVFAVVVLLATNFPGAIVAGTLLVCRADAVVFRRDRADTLMTVALAVGLVLSLPFLLLLVGDSHRVAPLAISSTLYTQVDDNLIAFSPFGAMHVQAVKLLEIGLAVVLVRALAGRGRPDDRWLFACAAVVAAGVALSVARGLPIGRHLMAYAPAFWALAGLVLARFIGWLRSAFDGGLQLRVAATVCALVVADVLAAGLGAYRGTYIHALAPFSTINLAVQEAATLPGPVLAVSIPDYAGTTLWYYAHDKPGIVLRGVGNWSEPQRYSADPRPWSTPDFVASYVRRIEDYARDHRARVLLLVDRDLHDYMGVHYERGREIVAQLERRYGDETVTLLPGTHESVNAILLRSPSAAR